MRVGSHTARWLIFVCGLLLILSVYLAFKLPFIFRSAATEGIVTRNFIHGINKSDFGSTTSAEIKFYAGEIVVTFLGPEGQLMNKGEIVPVRYNPSRPSEAHIYTFAGYWLHGLLWCLLPAIFWVAICFSVIGVKKKK